jgi:predicted transcriptional regulator
MNVIQPFVNHAKPLPGCSMLPPMDSPSRDRKTKPKANGDSSKPKGTAMTADRFRVLNDFVDFSLKELKRAEIAVWLILYRDTRDGIAATGYNDLARRAGIDRRTVSRALRRLKQCGLVEAVYRGAQGRGVSRYRVHPLAQDV